jgi:AhpC/TSA family
MWRVAVWAIVLLAPLPAVQAQDPKKQDAQDLKLAGKLTADDDKDKFTKHPSKVHEHKMKAGTTYIIDLKSRQFDSFLRLEDSAGKELAKDDDSGGFPDARIVFKATKDDTYRIIATCFDGKVGDYTLTVKAATEAYTKLDKLKSDFQAGMMEAQKSAMVGKDFDMDKYFGAVGEVQLKFLDHYTKFAKDNAEDSSVGEAKLLIRQMVTGLGNSGSAKITDKLRTLADKAEDKDLLGAANFALGQHLAKRYESAYQKKDKGAAKLADEAEAVLEKTGKDFANLTNQVKEALFDLTKLAVGRTAMEIEAEDIDGKKFKLSDYRGKVVVIDFWGHW